MDYTANLRDRRIKRRVNFGQRLLAAVRQQQTLKYSASVSGFKVVAISVEKF